MSYFVVKADLKIDAPVVCALWNRYAPGVFTNKYAWMYLKNPAGEAHVWLVRLQATGECIGAAAVFPRRVVVNGTCVSGGIVGDLLIEPRHRGAGAALMVQRAVVGMVQSGAIDLLYGFPNTAASPILKRVGYRRLGERTRWVKILRVEPYLSRFPGGRYWGTIAGPVVDIVTEVWNRELWRRPVMPPGGGTVDAVDERFDRLWERFNRSVGIVGDRSAGYLGWKFSRDFHTSNRIWVLFDPSGQEVNGYIIYRLESQSIVIRDFYPNVDEPGMELLMQSFIRHARDGSTAAIVVSLLKNQRVKIGLDRFGFVEREDTSPVFFYASDRLSKAFPDVGDPEQWFLSYGDDDM